MSRTLAHRFKQQYERRGGDDWLGLLIDSERPKSLISRFTSEGVLYLVFTDGSVAQVQGAKANVVISF